MTNTPDEPLRDEEMQTIRDGSGAQPGRTADADTTDADGTDTTDADGTDTSDADGTDGTDADGTDAAPV